MHSPYHRAIERHLHTRLREGWRPIVLSIHSFNPELHGRARPWPVGLLWKYREPWLDTLFQQLRQQGLEVGDNQPYDGHVMMGYSLERHAIPNGLRHLLVEVRNDGLATQGGNANGLKNCMLPWMLQVFLPLDDIKSGGFYPLPV
ncbi:hypothetical protein CO613_10070 [Lysobacteraceae bacterium NML07-0707]|nr:hypothetical protein CO613_10070 [Xanthomonadaceae bacterium NML07-0707]